MRASPRSLGSAPHNYKRHQFSLPGPPVPPGNIHPLRPHDPSRRLPVGTARQRARGASVRSGTGGSGATVPRRYRGARLPRRRDRPGRACGSDPTPTGHRGSGAGAGANGLADPAGRKGRGAQGAASETWWRSGQPGMVCVSRIRGGRYFKYRPPPVSFVTVRSDLHGSDWA